jgi:hypothetical protein
MISMGNTGLYLAQNCPDHPRFRIIRFRISDDRTSWISYADEIRFPPVFLTGLGTGCDRGTKTKME